MKKKDFRLRTLPNGKKIYRYIPNGVICNELVRKWMGGEITAEMMRDGTKKVKYVFTESQYLQAINQ